MTGTRNGGARYRKGRPCRRQSRDKPAALGGIAVVFGQPSHVHRTAIAPPPHHRRTTRTSITRTSTTRTSATRTSTTRTSTTRTSTARTSTACLTSLRFAPIAFAIAL